VARPEPAIDLAEAALLIACEEYPSLDIEAYRARLDDLGRQALARAQALSIDGRVATLTNLLFVELGFRGNEQHYYDPRNSFLNDVLDRRVGIPITLSTVFLEVARRVGLTAAGVGLPGHFIVRVENAAGDALLIDPFHGGLRLSPADCQQRLDRIFEGKLRMAPDMLAACGPRQMLRRMLQNLKVIYVKAGDYERALGVLELLLCMTPVADEDLRDRGLVYAALDCYTLALHDLEQYLTRRPRVPEATELTDKIATLRALAARVH
jgi:regulator of sirC expression with transglutaminase-like and TPR domain